MQQYNLYVENFSDVSDAELFVEIGKTIKEFPFCGENMLSKLLKQKGFHVQRWRLRDALHTLDESGVQERKAGRLHRRVYNVKGPNHLCHIDTNDKLIRWHFIIVGGIDGYSRLVTFLQCKDNNKSETVLECFLTGVSKFGLPERVRSDKGLENIGVADFMISARGPGSMITGKSVHNQRKERMWRDVFQGVLHFYCNIFYFMEQQNILDPLNDSHIASLHYTFLSKINEKLDI